jgi:hypothetical protein
VASLRGACVEPLLERARVAPEKLQQCPSPAHAAPLLERQGRHDRNEIHRRLT